MVKTRLAAVAFSAAGLVALAGYEGYTDHAVIPVPGDVPTIGFGTTDGVKLGDKTTAPQALALALRDVQKFEGELRGCVKVPLYQYEYDAYVLLAYNIGPSAFCSSTLVHKLNGLDYPGACAEISRWDKFQGKPLRGLTNRRASERAMCEGK